MPRAKDGLSASTDPEHGFAALEAKVEEVQLDAALAGDGASEGVGAAAASMIRTAVSEQRHPAGSDEALYLAMPQVSPLPGARLLAPLTSLCSTVAACTESMLRLQTDALRSLAQVRSPQDLVSVQIDYGRQALELYTGNLARLTQSSLTLGR